MNKFCSFLPLLLLLCVACDSENSEDMNANSQESAKIIQVECTGGPNDYTLSVTIESPDTGCDQYANWWEVITPEGELVYRRILGHSHVNEQPFTRSGGPVQVGPTDTIIVRAHMNNLSYGTQVFKGIVLNDGLVQDSLAADFAIGLEEQEPLPGDCPF